MNERIEQAAREIIDRIISNHPENYNSDIHYPMMDAAMNMAEWALSHQWISVDEELPKCRDEKSGITDIVIAKSDLDYMFLAYYDYSNTHWYHNYEAIYDKEIYSKITSWMKIPQE